MKNCGRCKEQKPFDQFGKKGNGYESYCMPCRRVAQKEWVAADPRRGEKARERAKQWAKDNPEKAKENKRRNKQKNIDRYRENASHNHRLRTYNLTKNDYEELVERQNGLCAICKEDKKLWVDHDHVTGRVRGLLCPSCNNLVGYVETYGDLIDSANEYIVSHTV